LLDVLVSLLRLDFAYARLGISGSPVEFLRLAQRRVPAPHPREVGRALGRWLTANTATAPLAVPNPVGEGQVRIAPFHRVSMAFGFLSAAGSVLAEETL